MTRHGLAMRIEHRWKLLFACLGVTFLAFWPGLRGDFLNFDDPRTVLENPAFLEGGWAGLSRILDPRETIADVYLPVTYLSLWGDVALGQLMHGVDSAGARLAALPSMTFVPHVHSVVLHGLAAFCLLVVLVRLGLSQLAACVGALAFAVHPALAESVVWISGRKDVLSGVLVLAALALGQNVILRGRPIWPVFVLAGLACYAKATAVVLPVVGLGIWWWTAQAARRREAARADGDAGADAELGAAMPLGENGRVLRLAVGTAFLCGLATLHHSFLAAKVGSADFAGDAAALPGTFLHYLGVALWPSELAVHRPRTLLAAFAEGAALKALWLSVLIVAALVLLRRARGSLATAGVGLLLFFAALLPFNGVAPAFAIAAADRYLYLALPGLALVLAALCDAPAPRVRRVVGALGLVALLALSIPQARARSLDFTASDRLWTANLELYPRDDVSLVNLGEWKYATGDADEAEALFARAAQVVVEPVRAMRIAAQRMRSAMLRGRPDEARMHVERAIDIADDEQRRFTRARVDLRIQLIDLLDRLDRSKEARGVVAEVLAIAPEHPAALGRKAALELSRIAAEAKALPLPHGDAGLVEVARLLDRAFEHPAVRASAIPITARAEWHRLRGETSAASRVLDSYQGSPHESLSLQRARIYGSEGLVDEAMRELENGVRQNPGSIRIPRQLADLYLRARRFGDAESVLGALHVRYRDHAQIAKDYGSAIVEHARALVGKEEVENYAARVTVASKLVPENPRLALLEALVLGEKKRFVAALEKARIASKNEPRDLKVEQVLQGLLKRCGWLAFAGERKGRAFELWRELLGRPALRVDVAAVREAFTREVDRRADFATSKMMTQDFDAASSAWSAVLELDPKNANALVQLGVADFAQGKFAAAEPRLAQAVRASEADGLDPGLALLYRLRCLARLERGREAIELGDAYLRASATRKGDDRLVERVRTIVQRLKGAGGE